MLIVDDFLGLPLTGFLWIVRKIHDAAQQEMVAEEGNITAELSELYKMLETGKITDAEFDAREKELLDRLDRIEERTVRIGNEDAL